MPKLKNHPPLGLQDYSMHLNCIMHIQNEIFKNLNEGVQQCPMSTPLRCNLSNQKRTHTELLSFITESDLSIYNSGHKFIR